MDTRKTGIPDFEKPAGEILSLQEKTESVVHTSLN
jgi:hypothetical protein